MHHYYRILGVERSAAPAEVKRAYHRLARKFHPDHHAGHPMAQERFRLLAEAYTVLGDTEQRREYDRYGAVALQKHTRPGVAGGMERFVANLEGLLDARMSRIPKRGRDLRIVAEISLRQSVTGGQICVEFERRERCPDCEGSRAATGSATERCHVCGGGGQLKRGGGLLSVSEPCPFCQAFGVVALSPCAVCEGLGEAVQGKSVVIDTPAGVETGRRLALRGLGSPGENGGEAGDLFVELQVQSHALLARSGHDLECTVPISLKEALCGTTVDVPLLDGDAITVRVKPGTAGGQILRLRGRGLPRPAGGAGDLLITLELETPVLDARKQRQLLDALDAASAHPKREAYRAALKGSGE